MDMKMDFVTKKISFFSFLVLFFAGNVQAQQTMAYVNLSKDSVLIGDTLSMFINASAPANTLLVLPQLKDTVSESIEILDRKDIDTLKSHEELQLRQQYKLIAFDSGYYRIPPLPVIYGNDVKDTVWTGEKFLAVNTIQVDTSKAFFDIKPPMDAPYTFREFLPYILWGLLGLAVIIALYLYWRTREKREAPPPPPAPEIPAHVTALQKLEALRTEKLWQKGNVKEYHSRVTEIVREYIEKRFDIRALEQTSTEIMGSMRHSGLFSGDLLEKMQHILSVGDLAKFAKIQPSPDDNEKSLDYALEFVNKTLPEEKQPVS